MPLTKSDSSENGTVEHPQGAQSRAWARPALIGIALGAVIVALVTTALRSRSDETIVLNVVEASDASRIRVYVGGEVVEPGIYTLDRDGRIVEAIDAAGGKTSAGDISQLQLGATLQDGDQVIVPRVRPTPRAASATGPAAAVIAAPSAPIDINTATATELEALPEIGPKLAERIIEYRDTNGRFTSVDELAEIRGISERMVDVLRPLVQVGQ